MALVSINQFTNDKVIRTALKSNLKKEFENDPEAIIVDEFGLNHGDARIDVAVVNGIIHGYELKSDVDSLQRLPNQAKIYNLVLDKVTLVVGRTHVFHAISIIPEWWGIVVAKQSHNAKTVDLLEVRPSAQNPTTNKLAIANLLWKSEVLSILEEFNLADGVRSKPKNVLYDRLISSLDQVSLKNEVRKKLCARRGWRFGR